MPKVTEAHMQARREQILAAAHACFGRKGFHQTTMQDICEAAELSPGAVYRYFPSKETIIAACCQDGQAQVVEAVQQLFAQALDTQAVIEALLTEFFLHLERSVPEVGAEMEMAAEAARNPEINAAYREQRATIVRELARVLRRGQERGEVAAEIDVDAAAQVLLATWQGLVMQLSSDPGIDVRSYVEALRMILERGILRV